MYQPKIKLSEINEQIEKIKLPENDKKAILNLIDIKIENDMEKTLLKMDAIQKESVLRMDNIKTEMSAIKNEMNVQISSIKWFIVTALAIIGIMIAFMNYSNNQRNATPLNGNNVEIKK